MFELQTIRDTWDRIAPHVIRTPSLEWTGPAVAQRFGTVNPVLKLELFQRAGTFKPRGAIARLLDDAAHARKNGVTAVSAGNHAMAVAYAANAIGADAKVVMPRSANAGRVAGCRALGAEIVLVDNVHAAFEEVRRIESEEGRVFVHPFEGHFPAVGTATLGLEFLEQVPQLDAIFVPIGGGGLAAGIATAVKLRKPGCLVFGVEPEGADTMHRSFAAGTPQSIETVKTIADSLGAPHAAPYSFELCRAHLDDLVLISDDEIVDSMRLLFEHAKIAVEPAGAASTAGCLAALRRPEFARALAGKTVGLIICGANIDLATYCSHVGYAPSAPR